jgi:Rrf2 family nitric oxide-sensitive transcriptional repressor
VRQTEDDLVLVECFGGGACAITASCRLRRVLSEALAAFLAVLDRYTLADLLGGPDGDAIAQLLGLAAPAAADGAPAAAVADLPEG